MCTLFMAEIHFAKRALKVTHFHYFRLAKQHFLVLKKRAMEVRHSIKIKLAKENSKALKERSYY